VAGAQYNLGQTERRQDAEQRHHSARQDGHGLPRESGL